MIFEKRPEGGEQVNIVVICRKLVPGRGSSRSEDPDVEWKHAHVIKE